MVVVVVVVPSVAAVLFSSLNSFLDDRCRRGCSNGLSLFSLRLVLLIQGRSACFLRHERSSDALRETVLRFMRQLLWRRRLPPPTDDDAVAIVPDGDRGNNSGLLSNGSVMQSCSSFGSRKKTSCSKETLFFGLFERTARGGLCLCSCIDCGDEGDISAR